MDKFLMFLDTYKGRDRVLRLLCYSSKCAAGLINSQETASKYDNFSKQLSTSRACFRLLDDLPTIIDILENASKKRKESSLSKTLFFAESTIDIFFNIFDHISWAVEHRILLSESTFWDNGSTICWVISLYISIIRTLSKLSYLSKHKMEVKGQFKDREKVKKLRAEQWKLQMSVLKNVADLLFAVNYLPKGILWGNTFKKWQVGAIGTFSSIIALYQSLCL